MSKTDSKVGQRSATPPDTFSKSLQSRRLKSHGVTRSKEDIDQLRIALAEGLGKYWKANPGAHDRLRRFLRDEQFEPQKLSPNAKGAATWEKLPWIHIRAMLGLLDGMNHAEIFGTGSDKAQLQRYRDILQWACAHSLNGVASAKHS